ncbi:OLC1v1029516C1 [Oldenlandia corymbosa var. corymbosa]|uniref:OLC1v1029516C1 n=1 Tax=Oldenlandia corymbosa var. corymbosa TaxID=529605 RepID=A0AAV1CH02_OLDCO|nr:OLC1v1029516C1 [Oldenlandia corymbosa var. corymbosa]
MIINFVAAAPNYRFMHEATSAPDVSFYDYIIVGGGTAGCPLAATLSQNYSVLLLERGGSPYGNPNITYLSAFGAALSDLSPASPSQRFISEDGVINARARVLGGGSCLNAGFYTRAPTTFGDGLGWDADLVKESYEWVEKKVAFEPPVKQWQSAVRDGLVESGVTPYNGFTYDHIYGTKIGGSIFDLDGNRHTAADLLEYANPSGLTVLLYASVHKILFRNQVGERPRARGVIFRDASGTKHKAYIKKGGKSEVIISSGALGSPQLLMLSGIGPEKELKSHNITVVLDQPWVGSGMADNPMNAVFVPSPADVEVSLIQVVGITQIGSYIEAASGENFAGASTTRDFGMFSPKIGQLSTLPPKERTAEALARAIDAMSELDDSVFNGGFILEKVMGPVSKGNLTLRNKNPNDNPIVHFNYFQEPEDLERCVSGMKIIEDIIESKSFINFRYNDMPVPVLLNMTASAPVNLLPKHMNVSTSLEQFCKDTVMTIWHYHGGCHVGKVVDNDYKVIGVDNLRVIDGSTFTYSPGTNPQATVMMLGRYMGVKMLQERLASEAAK